MHEIQIRWTGPLIEIFRDFNKHITLKTTGPGESFARDVNFSELKASDSIFATALRNNPSTTELQEIANTLSKQGFLATNPHAAIALKTFVYFLKSLRVNTARWLPTKGTSSSDRYKLDFQLSCMELAVQLKATKFGETVALEVMRESFFVNLSIDQFRRACNVNGLLDEFLVAWASGLDGNYVNHRGYKLGCLNRAFEVSPSLRAVFIVAFQENEQLFRENKSGQLPEQECDYSRN